MIDSSGAMILTIFLMVVYSGQSISIKARPTEFPNSIVYRWGSKVFRKSGDLEGSFMFANDDHQDLYLFEGSNWTIVKSMASFNSVCGSVGSFDSNYHPSIRQESMGWASDSGDLFLFGGYIPDGQKGYLNDLWKFRVETLEWGYLGGCQTSPSSEAACDGIYSSDANALPAGRKRAASWIGSNGLFYLFGGSSNNGWYNDLWVLRPSTSSWTWLGGSNTINQPSNTGWPGSREGMALWTLPDGSAYFFGGYGTKEDRSAGGLAEMWSHSTMGWKKIAMNPVKSPHVREGASTWVGSHDGRLYLFGGIDRDLPADEAYLSDFWGFNLETANWTLSLLLDGPDWPSARSYAPAWVDEDGGLALASGDTGTQLAMSDAWRFGVTESTIASITVSEYSQLEIKLKIQVTTRVEGSFNLKGVVNVKRDNTPIGSCQLIEGKCEIVVPFAACYQLTANYDGDSHYEPSSVTFFVQRCIASIRYRRLPGKEWRLDFCDGSCAIFEKLHRWKCIGGFS
eukprot:TRINITY_DN2691_c0_g1_i1.p1 TRINITY_DN2691_c0_g1~~TRINITY_DN2691_c0_g1_i1.p1  ORF type:complete len:511 (-),score=84.36 TRINITY_DN2691_c0_g1_i1:1440-2972(-)